MVRIDMVNRAHLGVLAPWAVSGVPIPLEVALGDPRIGKLPVNMEARGEIQVTRLFVIQHGLVFSVEEQVMICL